MLWPSDKERDMTDESRTLDLDELLGLARPVKVRWKGQEYGLRDIESMDPTDYVRWLQLEKQINLDSGADGIDEAGAQNMIQATEAALALISPELAKLGLTFLQQMTVLKFYATETLGSEALGAVGSKNSESA